MTSIEQGPQTASPLSGRENAGTAPAGGGDGRRTISPRAVRTLLVALLIVTADAFTKWLVRNGIALGERIEIVPGLLTLTHVQNTGAAYGLLTGQRWLLVLSAAIIAAATPLLLRAIPISSRWAWAGPVLTGMILGGAVGNLVERARSGYVTDFLTMPLVPLFQVFNVADAAISVSITALLLISLFGGEGTPSPADPARSGEHRGDPERHDASPAAQTADIPPPPKEGPSRTSVAEATPARSHTPPHADDPDA